MKLKGCLSVLICRSGRNFLAAGTIVAVVLHGGCADRSAVHHSDLEYFDFSAAQAVAAQWSHTENIDFGTPDGRQVLLNGWSVDELWAGETTFVWGIGDSSELRFHRFSRGDLRLRLRCQPLAGFGGQATRAIRVAVNEVNLSEVELQPGGFRTYEVLIPSESLSVGENRIGFQYDSAPMEGSRPSGENRDLRVAWDWLKVDSNEFRGTSVPADGTADDVLMLPLGTRTDFFVELRPDSRIEWTAAPGWNAASSSSMELYIEVETDDGQRHTFVIRAPGLSEQHPGSQALPSVRTFARVSFVAVRVSGDSGSGGALGMALHAPRLVGPPEPHEKTSFQQHTSGKPAPPITKHGKRPNIIVYLIDALRADHLGTYGYSKSVSPNIDAFAADAVLFEKAFAQSSWTKTSVASILTGLLPRSHGTFERDHVVPPIPSYLPALLQDAGYRTVAVSASGIVAPDFGFDRGFEEFRFLEPEGDDQPVFAYSDEVTDLFLDWLSEHAESNEPFFAYLHTLDPHDPYGPPGLEENPPPDRGSELWEFRRPAEDVVNEFLETHPEFSKSDIRDHFLQLYDEDISFNDRQFGRLIERLKGLGIYDSTVIVFLSDHGEEFLDHGHWAHGRTLYSEQLHIPLLVKLPGQIAGGKRVTSVAQHIDLVPTILATAGVEVPSEVEGTSLIPHIRGPVRKQVEPASRTVVLGNLNLDRIEIDSILRGDLHLMLWETDQPDERVELYDLREDPNERINLAPQRPASVGFLRALLKSSTLKRTVTHEPEQLRIEGDVEKRLRALGYIE